jgi:hypothetical protein
MHLDGPAEGESFMRREGVSVDAQPDDLPEWLDNEKPDPLDIPDGDDHDLDDDEDNDDDDWDDDDEEDE